MNHYAFVPLLAFIINGFTWTYVYAQKQKNPTNTAYLILSGILGGWLALDFILWLPINRTWLVPLLRFQSIFWLSVGFWFLNLTYIFLKRRKNLPYYIFLISTVASVLVSISTNSVINGYTEHYWGVNSDVGILFVPLTFTVVTLPILYSLFLLSWKKRTTLHGNLRNQMILLLWGSSIPLVIGLLTNVILPYVLNIDDFLQITSSATVIQSIFIFVAIVKYRFLSIGLEEVANNLFMSAQDGILIVDKNRRVVQMNGAAKELLQLRHTGVCDIELSGLFKSCSFNESYENFETKITGDNEEKSVSVWQIAVESSGLELGKILIIKDITELKLAQKTVREHTQELKETQEQLLRSERLATIGQLAASVGHELRNPLGVIQNSLYLLSSGLKGADEKIKKQLTRMQTELMRSDKIISGLLDFSRKRKPSLVRTDVNRVIEEVLMRVNIPDGVEVIRKLADTPTVLADSEQLQGVFINLICNGIEAMPQGGTLRVETRQEDRFVKVTVSDTGTGIPNENLRSIFEPLFTTKSKGIGLGLSITKRTIENHGGAIEVESEPDRGTAFTVQLPIEKEKKSCQAE